MSPVRDNLEPGRHAHPVDQAEAVLWAADLRQRGLVLAQHYESMLAPEYLTTMAAVASWMDAAYHLVKEVADSCR